MLFNFPDRMLGQILVYLGNNACLHVGVECISQFSESPRRSNYNEGFHLARPDHLLHGGSDLSCEAMLLDVMPIGWLDGTPLRSLANVPRPLGTLLVAGWIFLLNNLLSLEVRKFLVAIISQEQGFSTVADKHVSIMRNFEFIHVVLVIDLVSSVLFADILGPLHASSA